MITIALHRWTRRKIHSVETDSCLVVSDDLATYWLLAHLHSWHKEQSINAHLYWSKTGQVRRCTREQMTTSHITWGCGFHVYSLAQNYQLQYCHRFATNIVLLRKLSYRLVNQHKYWPITVYSNHYSSQLIKTITDVTIIHSERSWVLNQQT